MLTHWGASPERCKKPLELSEAGHRRCRYRSLRRALRAADNGNGNGNRNRNRNRNGTATGAAKSQSQSTTVNRYATAATIPRHAIVPLTDHRHRWLERASR